MKITIENYQKIVKQLGLQNLPAELQEAHRYLKETTNNFKNWNVKSKDFQELKSLAFQKLGKLATGLSGNDEKDDSPYIKQIKEDVKEYQWMDAEQLKRLYTMELSAVQEGDATPEEGKIRLTAIETLLKGKDKKWALERKQLMLGDELEGVHLTPKQIAINLLKPHVLAGDTTRITDRLSVNEHDFSAHVKGHSVIVTMIYGTEIHEVFTIKELMGEIAREYMAERNREAAPKPRKKRAVYKHKQPEFRIIKGMLNWHKQRVYASQVTRFINQINGWINDRTLKGSIVYDDILKILEQLNLVKRLMADWADIELSPELKKRLQTALSKVTDSEQSGKPQNPEYDTKLEISFFQRFLGFNRKTISKSDLKVFIRLLQDEIKAGNIRKISPNADIVSEIQNIAVFEYNTNNDSITLRLPKELVQRIRKVIKDFTDKDLGLEPDSPVGPVDLSGIDQPQPEINVIPSDELSKKEYVTIGFTGKWLRLMGDPTAGFTAMVFGKPKMGKSFFCVDFAGYLAKNFGKVLYVTKEEKFGYTFYDKLKRKNAVHENLFIADVLPDDISGFNFIFLDSVTAMGLTPEQLRDLKEKHPGKSFVFIFQTTKAGNFRGVNTFQHDVDIIIEVPERGKAVQNGRFNQGGEMNIFEEEDFLPESEEIPMLAGINKPKVNNKGNKYPAWTRPKHLNNSDHAKLRTIYDLYKAGDFKGAMHYASYSCDTVIREEIPGNIWKEMGGQLTKTGEERLKANRKGKTLELLTDFGVSLEELAMDFFKQKNDYWKIVDLIDHEIQKVEKAVFKMSQEYIKDESAIISVKEVKFVNIDSTNLSHGSAHFIVTLEGTKKELQKVAGHDRLFYCDWEQLDESKGSPALTSKKLTRYNLDINVHDRLQNDKTLELLTELASSKANSWDEVNRVSAEKFKGILDLLAVVDEKDQGIIKSPSEKLPIQLREKVFILLRKNKVYYIDTQGYDYARYVLEIRNYEL